MNSRESVKSFKSSIGPDPLTVQGLIDQLNSVADKSLPVVDTADIQIIGVTSCSDRVYIDTFEYGSYS